MSGQNTSSAVMQQRSEPHDSLDDFPTQPWATRALIRHVIMPNMTGFDPGAQLKLSSVWEPACNRGYMSKPLREFFGKVHTSDIFNYGSNEQDHVTDFFFDGSEPSDDIDWIITNPPFKCAERFVARASAIANRGFAVIVRTAFLEGVGRYLALFSKNPPSIIAQFAERVPMVKGRVTRTGSTATAYCWLVWMEGNAGTRLVWIPPCRKKLETATDYEGCE